MDELPPRSLEVDLAPIGRRRSSIAPLAVALAAAAFVLVALVKPWEVAPDPRDGAGARAAGDDSAPTTAEGSRTPGPSAAGAVVALDVTADAVAAAARPRAAWGVRAVVLPRAATGELGRLEERWAPVEVEDDPAWDLPAPGPTVGDGEAVLALGVTTPPDALALDVRFWHLDGRSMPRRVAVTPVRGPEPGTLLWRPAYPAGPDAGAWPPGTYRIDLLMGQRIVRLLAVVEGADPSPEQDVIVATLPADLPAAIAPLGDGAFVVADGEAVGVRVRALEPGGLPLDERLAWLGPGDGARPSRVGSVSTRSLSAIGAVLPAGAWAPRVWLDVVAPIRGTVSGLVEIVPLGPAGAGAGRTAILLRADDPRPFASGLFRLTVMWTTAAGEPRWSIWHLDVTPWEPAVVPETALSAVRRWSEIAPELLGDAREPVVTERDRLPSDTGLCAGRPIVTRQTRLLGVTIAPGPPVVSIRLHGPGAHTRVDTRAAPAAADGLAVVALPRSGLAPGRYRLEVVRGTGTADRPATEGTSYDVCVS